MKGEASDSIIDSRSLHLSFATADFGSCDPGVNPTPPTAHRRLEVCQTSQPPHWPTRLAGAVTTVLVDALTQSPETLPQRP